MALLRPNFRTESDTQNAGNGISGGSAPDPPSIVSISKKVRSDLRLDPPLPSRRLIRTSFLPEVESPLTLKWFLSCSTVEDFKLSTDVTAD